VSVVIPVWNVEPYLRQCLDSVLGQTIGPARLEVIAVDDGSTDASGAILDEYAASQPNVTVVHQPNSGGPGGPRNVGLDRAASPYVFFLDADDYLGPEALERLVAMAERARSDIVIGKVVGVEGRRHYAEGGIFAESLERAPLSLVYRSGSVLKLFRRSFLARVGARMPEGLGGGEDGDLMARLFFEAAVVSIVADYDCYFARKRRGSQTLRVDTPDQVMAALQRVERERIGQVVARRRRGRARDRLLRRHMKWLARTFGRLWRSFEAPDRRRVFEVGAEIARRWSSDRIEASLPAWARLRIHCLRRGLLEELEDIVAWPPEAAFRPPLVEGRRLYARYPHFRDRAAIPDRCFEISREVRPEVRLLGVSLEHGVLHLEGEAFLRLVGGSTTVELRRWPVGAVLRFPTTQRATPLLNDRAVRYPEAGFELEVDLSTAAAGGKPVGTGRWAVRLQIGTGVVLRATPIRVKQRGLASAAKAGRVGSSPARLYVGPARDLRIQVGRGSAVSAWLERVSAVLGRAARVLRRLTQRITG
jgi:CDP-glycerol glycerophosphotransferase